MWGGKGGWKLYCQLNFSKVLWKMAKLNYFASYSKDQRGENKMQTELFDSNWIKDPHQNGLFHSPSIISHKHVVTNSKVGVICNLKS